LAPGAPVSALLDAPVPALLISPRPGQADARIERGEQQVGENMPITVSSART